MPRKPFSPVKLGVIGLGRFGIFFRHILQDKLVSVGRRIWRIRHKLYVPVPGLVEKFSVFDAGIFAHDLDGVFFMSFVKMDRLDVGAHVSAYEIRIIMDQFR